LIVLLGLSYFLFGNDASSGPNQIALLFCGTIAAAIAYKNGMSWDGIRQAVVDGIAIGLPAIMILLAVGALIGTWALSGTLGSDLQLLTGLQISEARCWADSAKLLMNFSCLARRCLPRINRRIPGARTRKISSPFEKLRTPDFSICQNPSVHQT
jgi:hypothetical protein